MDEVINLLASERVFYTQVADKPRLFTRYTGFIAASPALTVGQVVSKESYAEVMAAPTSYGSFRLFSQHNWFSANTVLGSRPESCRFSHEYLEIGELYACCSADCNINVALRSGAMVAFVK